MIPIFCFSILYIFKAFSNKEDFFNFWEPIHKFKVLVPTDIFSIESSTVRHCGVEGNRKSYTLYFPNLDSIKIQFRYKLLQI